MASSAIAGVDTASEILSYAGKGSFLFVAINKDWLQAHGRAFGAANRDTIVATEHMSVSRMSEVLNSDAPFKMDLMNILVKKGLFAFALMASRSPHFMRMFSPTTFCLAAYSGNLPMTAYIGRSVRAGFPGKKHVALCAAAGGSVSVIKFLLREGHMPGLGTQALSIIYDSMVHEAIGHARVDALSLLLNDDGFRSDIGGIDWGGWRNVFAALTVSARAGDIPTLHWFGAHGGVKGCDDVYGVLCIEAAGAGQFETLKFLKARGYRLTSRAFKACGKVAGKEMLDWMHQQGCPKDKDIFVEAAISGNLAAIRSL